MQEDNLPEALPVKEAEVEVEEAENAGPTAAELNDGRPCLTDKVFEALGHLEHNFIFRKLGVVFDYVSRPGDFPAASFPKGNEAREGIPNKAGIGTGIANTTANTCLLIDAYLTRLELGLSRSYEARVMDRLVAGLIRLGTLGQKGKLIRGITPDGRGYYASCDVESYTYYAHGILRSSNTPTIAFESQGKLRNICGKWLQRLKQDEFVIPALTPEKSSLLPEHNVQPEMQAWNWERRIRLLHLAAVAKKISSQEHWQEIYDRCSSDENGGCAIRSNLPATLTDSGTLLALQVALSDLASLQIAEKHKIIFNLLRRKIAYRVSPWIGRYKQFTADIPLENALLDWRKELPQNSGSVEELQQQVYQTWPRLRQEAEHIRPALQGALCLMLSGDHDLQKDNVRAIVELVNNVTWDQLWDAGSLTALPLLHALGHEFGFWDYSLEHRLERFLPGESLGYDFAEGYVLQTEPVPVAKRRTKPLYPAFIEEAEEQLKPAHKSGKSGHKKSGKSRAGQNRSAKGQGNNGSDHKGNSNSRNRQNQSRNRRGKRRHPRVRENKPAGKD